MLSKLSRLKLNLYVGVVCFSTQTTLLSSRVVIPTINQLAKQLPKASSSVSCPDAREQIHLIVQQITAKIKYIKTMQVQQNRAIKELPEGIKKIEILSKALQKEEELIMLGIIKQLIKDIKTIENPMQEVE